MPRFHCVGPVHCDDRNLAQCDYCSWKSEQLNHKRRRLLLGIFLMGGYIATVPLSNWMIGHVGTECIPDGPCLIPVWPGILAPSGVLVIGLALLLRDLVQRLFGAEKSIVCIIIGAGLSIMVAPPSLALASGIAFLFSEILDFAVYTPLAKNKFIIAVVLSCAAGAVADSLLFLYFAFGDLSHLRGQIIGKLYAVAFFISMAPVWRRFIR